MTATERLDLFFDRTTELFNTRLARNEGLESSFSMKFNQEGSQFSISNPDEDDLRSYLMTYRQFISNNEPIFLDRVHNTLWLSPPTPLRLWGNSGILGRDPLSSHCSIVLRR